MTYAYFMIRVIFLILTHGYYANESIYSPSDGKCTQIRNNSVLNEKSTCIQQADWFNENPQNISSNINSKLHVVMYNLTYDFSDNLNDYCGLVKINFQLSISTKTRNKIVIQSENTLLDITIREVGKESSHSRNTIQIRKVCELGNNKQYYVIIFNQPLKFSETYQLDMIFEGAVSQKPEGITAHNENSRTSVITQLFPNHAPKAFPCIDEPHIKSKFLLQLMHNSFYNSFSNTFMSSRKQLPNNKALVVFEITPPISTYSLAFTINVYSLVGIGTATANKLILTSLLPSNIKFEGKNESGLTGLIQKNLILLESITGTKFPPEQLIVMGIPDFKNDTTGGWGIIFTDLNHILRKGKSDNEIIESSKVIHHQIISQWFGAYVTPRSWNHGFLSEGLVLFLNNYLLPNEMQSKAIYFKLEGFMYDYLLDLDQNYLTTPVYIPGKYNEYPTDKTYNVSATKSCFIIRMLYHTLGQDNFEKFMQRFLAKFAFKSFKMENFDLILHRTAETYHIAEMVKTWSSNPGFLEIQASLYNNLRKDLLVVTYKRFNERNTMYLNKKENDRKWVTPLFYKIKYDNQDEIQTGQFWTYENTKYIKMNGTISWIIINKDRIGPYVSHYNDKLWEGLMAALRKNSTILTPIEKHSLISDTNRLAKNKYVLPQYMFSLLEALFRERNPYVSAILIISMEDFLKNSYGLFLFPLVNYELTSFRLNYLNFLMKQSDDALLHIEPQDKATELDRYYLNKVVLEKCYTYGCTTILKTMFNLFDNWELKKTAPCNLETIQNIVLAIVFAGNQIHFKFLESIITETSFEETLSKSVSALAQINDEKILLYLDESLYQSFIPENYLMEFFISVATNRQDASIIWKFLKYNWQAIRYKFNNDKVVLSELFYKVISTSSKYSIETNSEVKKFYDKNREYLLPFEEYQDTIYDTKINRKRN